MNLSFTCTKRTTEAPRLWEKNELAASLRAAVHRGVVRPCFTRKRFTSHCSRGIRLADWIAIAEGASVPHGTALGL